MKTKSRQADLGQILLSDNLRLRFLDDSDLESLFPQLRLNQDLEGVLSLDFRKPVADDRWEFWSILAENRCCNETPGMIVAILIPDPSERRSNEIQ